MLSCAPDGFKKAIQLGHHGASSEPAPITDHSKLQHRKLNISRKGESTMNRLLKLVLAFGLVGSFVGSLAFHCQGTASAKPSLNSIQGVGKGMREFKGVKPGMKRDDARAAAGKPETSGDDMDEFKLNGDDTMTVRYDNGEVKAIQLAFLDPKNAPAWKE